MLEHGWKDHEDEALRSAVSDARASGAPLSSAFRRVAEKTGRMPNSVRNHYYELLRKSGVKANRSVPFTDEEARKLVAGMTELMKKGCSVRKAALELAGGDASLMLRYQNKYRSLAVKDPSLDRGSRRDPRRRITGTEQELLDAIDAKDRELKQLRERFALLRSLIGKLAEQDTSGLA